MNAMTHWFALQTRPRSEKQVQRLLTHKEYDSLLPTYRQKRRWSDRNVEIELPLFPTYLFCRFNSSALGKVISTPGVIRIVGIRGEPAEVNPEEINALQLLTQSNLLREPWVFIPDGTLVQVETGPLAGAQGIFCSGKDRGRLVISVVLLQRSIAVHLDEKTLVSVIESPKEDQAIISSESNLALKLMKRARNSSLADRYDET